MQLFYCQFIELDKPSALDESESRHVVKVLRHKTGDLIHLINGDGKAYAAKIMEANPKKCVAVPFSVTKEKVKWNYHLHIAIAPTKQLERFEWFVEKATEIGIDEITPVICHRSVRKRVKVDRQKKILISAVKQSQGLFLPRIQEPVVFKEFIQNISTDKDLGALFIATCLPDLKPLQAIPVKSKNCLILIGPEGDFNEEELELAIEAGFQPINLGQNRYRVETAGIIATHIISLKNSKS